MTAVVKVAAVAVTPLVLAYALVRAADAWVSDRLTEVLNNAWRADT